MNGDHAYSNGANGMVGSSTMKVTTSSSSSLFGRSLSSGALQRSQSGHQRGMSSQMFIAPGPVITGATQTVTEYRKRKVALITGRLFLTGRKNCPH